MLVLVAMTEERAPTEPRSGAPQGVPHGAALERVQRLLDGWTLGELQFAGPGRIRFDQGHKRCCRMRGHSSGWCNQEPEHYERERHAPRLRPEPPEIERMLVDAAIQEGTACLTWLERLAFDEWANICWTVGYPPFETDETIRQAWRDKANPLWQQIGRHHRIGPDYEQNLTASERLRRALHRACGKIAEAAGWIPPPETATPDESADSAA